MSKLSNALINNGTCDTIDEADELIREMKIQVMDGEDPEELLYDCGLEPDYIFDILP